MATKKELVEAYSFSRRRLVTAFLSGAPGGREVEPSKPARSLVGGVALAVLLCAGAGVAGFLGGRPDSTWKSEGSFVLSKDTGEKYVILHGGDDPVLQRVPNYISGQLLLGSSEPEIHHVKDEHIRTVTLGPDLGIEGAPALPHPDQLDQLIDSGWTACTAAERGVKVNLAHTPDVEPAPRSAFVVRTGKDDLWLLAASPQGPAYRFAMPDDPTGRSALLDALDFGASSQAPVVSADWLNLFRPGPELTREAFGVTRDGDPVDYADLESDLSGFDIGDLVETEDGFYLLGDTNPQALDEFPAMVYEAVAGSAVQLPGDLRAELDAVEHPEEWPTAAPAVVSGEEMCAVLQEDDGATHVVPGVDPGASASATDLVAGSHDVDVEPSGGAHVLAGADGADDDGSPYVIDAKGAKYALVGPFVEEYIGYADHEAPVVSEAWLRYFDDGVPLSVNSARRVNEDAPDESDAPEEQ